MVSQSRAETDVQIAAGLYDARRALRSLNGDNYAGLVGPWMDLVKRAMALESKPCLSAVLVLSQHTTNPFDHLWLMAAAVEVIESATAN